MLASKAHPEPHQRLSIYIPSRHRLFVRKIAAEAGICESEVYKRLIEEKMRAMKDADERCEGA